VRDRATELEWLSYFYQNADFGPAHADVEAAIKERFMKETNKNLPEGYNLDTSDETVLDQ